MSEDDLADCRAIWHAGRNLEDVSKQLCDVSLARAGGVEQSAQQPAGSVEQPARAITQAPKVWALLEQTENDDEQSEAMKWLLFTYLWSGGTLTSLKLLPTSETIPLDDEKPEPAHLRLETAIRLTEQRRSNYIEKPSDVLSEATPKTIIADWKGEYRTWMNASSQAQWWKTPANKRHDFVHARFRNFLFKICGCVEIVKFWLRVHASSATLCIFKSIFCDERSGASTETNTDKVNGAVKQVQRSLSVSSAAQPDVSDILSQQSNEC